MKCNKCGNEYDYRCEVCWPDKNGSVGKPQLDDIDEVEWTRHARGLPFDEVLECYINDIESVTNCFDRTELIKRSLKELLKIYVNVI